MEGRRRREIGRDVWEKGRGFGWRKLGFLLGLGQIQSIRSEDDLLGVLGDVRWRLEWRLVVWRGGEGGLEVKRWVF